MPLSLIGLVRRRKRDAVVVEPPPPVAQARLGAITPDPASEGAALLALVLLVHPTTGLPLAAPTGGASGAYTWDGDPAATTPADAGDFSGARTGTWTVAAGQTQVAVTATLADDVTQEGAEGVRCTITAGTGCTLGTPSSRTGAVSASDQPPPERGNSIAGSSDNTAAIVLPQGSVFTSVTDFTIRAFVRVQSTGASGYQTLLGFGVGGDAFMLALFASGAGWRPRFYANGFHTANTPVAADLAVGEFHEVWVTRSGTTLTYSVNAADAGSVTVPATAITLTNSARRLAGDGGGEVLRTNTYLSDVAVWTRALSSAERTARRLKRLVAANETNLAGYWKLDEGSGTTVADSAGTATGTVSAGLSWSTLAPAFT